MNEKEKEALEILNNTEWDGFMITIKNLINKQNKVIDRMATTIMLSFQDLNSIEEVKQYYYEEVEEDDNSTSK